MSNYWPICILTKKNKIILIPTDTRRVKSLWKMLIFIVEWIKIFSHNTSGGLFKSIEDALSKNVDDPEALLYSKLNLLDDLRSAGGFHFAVCYPELIEGTYCNKFKFHWPISPYAQDYLNPSDFCPNSGKSTPIS